MATTTNYGWTTPNDTDLVKDGASAIRTLGSAIDSTVFTNASAGIAKTLIDAKGDLIAGSAADTAARLAVGTNGYLLAADSTASTGLAWTAPPSSGGMTVIASGSISGTTLSINSIPSTYTNLQLFVANINDASNSILQMRVNSNTGAEYSHTRIQANSINYQQYGNYWDSVASCYGTGSFTINFPSYANTSGGKQMQKYGFHYANANAFFYNANMQDSNPISSIQLFNNNGTSFTGGTYTLYGVK